MAENNNNNNNNNNNKERIFFGSLEVKEKERLEGKAPPRQAPAAVPQGGVMPFTEHAAQNQERQKALMQRLEVSRRARQIVVPTNDDFVKAKLREIGHPIILFGEKPEDRRERLREHLAKLGVADGFPAGTPSSSKMKRDEEGEEEGYLTEAVPELKPARLFLAEYSIPRAMARLSDAKRRRESPPSPSCKDDMKKSFSQFVNVTSEIGDERPMSAVGFSPNSEWVFTGGWSGASKLWQIDTVGMPSCRHALTLRGHSERVHDVAFHPQSTFDLSPTSLNFVTASSDRTLRCWALAPSDEANGNGTTNNNNINNNNLSSHSNPNLVFLTALATLTGHEDRINGVEFHPSGRYIGSCSSDKTWRLYDAETRKELLIQDGHSKAIHAISFHPDGSLVATGGEDNAVRVWDLRSGRPLWSFNGHVKQVVDIDWAPDGYHIASSSDDHSVRIWDLRKRRSTYILTAHASLISSVRYQKGSGSGGVWDTYDWSPVKVLAGHEQRIMAADISPNSKYIATAAYDRTWKLWCDDNSSNISNDVVDTIKMET